MQQLISVEFTDGTRCEMIPAALNLFLREKDWVRRFRRTNGWAWVGLSPMRNEHARRDYGGVNRRMSA